MAADGEPSTTNGAAPSQNQQPMQPQQQSESAPPASNDNGSAESGDAASGNKRRGDIGKAEFNRQRNNDKKRKKDGKKGNDWRELKRRKYNKQGEEVDDDRKKNNPFSQEEIAGEERRPKRKVAVMIGYSGTGYKGMQVNGDDPTIERDLFRAFIEAGAIAKVNADDPRKSSLARCARTDKGVHAAGNVISLKLIIEDEDVLEKINNALPPQIRVWGIQRTNNSYNCYQYCDSRWYEYLLPSYCLLPPHPQTFLGKSLAELNKQHGGEEEAKKALADVENFWEQVDEKEIKPILERLDPEIRERVLQQIHVLEPLAEDAGNGKAPVSKSEAEGDKAAPASGNADEWTMVDSTEEPTKAEQPKQQTNESDNAGKVTLGSVAPKNRSLGPFDYALRDIKAAYISAKKRYRISTERLQRLQSTLDAYVGTHNFHNYTVQKAYSDPSAKRHIKSFAVNPEPVIMGGTEWLSLKVHGQSFMMHQIRKMVGLATLMVRAGTPLARVGESYGPRKMAIPKAPGLGLLLERPVFENYNRRAEAQLGREAINFDKYDEKLEAFKRQEIYTRIFDVEEDEHSFHMFFNQIDQFKSTHFLWLSAGGLDVAQLTNENETSAEKDQQDVDKQLGDEDEDPEGGEG